MRASIAWAGVCAAVFAAGCGAASASMAPLQAEVVAVTVRGDLAVRRGGDWEPLAAGGAATGVRELRAGRQGAIVTVGRGPDAARLWLRGGTRVRVGQDGQGALIAVEEGRARLAPGATAVRVVGTDGAASGDVLIERRDGAVARAVATGVRPAEAAWTLALEEAPQPAGIGRLDSGTDPLELRRLAVDVRTEGDLAVTAVEHVFYNPAPEQREGTFRFPVPDGAMVTGLAMEIGGTLMEGEIVEREKARATYEKIVDDMLDPALLEWEEGNWFKLRVFPIEAASEKRVVIRYAAPLARGESGWEYAHAFASPDRAPRIGDLTVRVNGDVVVHEKSVDRGLEVAVPLADAAVPAVMQEIRPDGVYTAVRLSPRWDGIDAPAAGPRRVVVIMDTSRSALEGKALASSLLGSVLGELGGADRFVVLASDIGVTPHAREMAAPTAASIAAARAFVDGIEPDGASDLGAALRAATTWRGTDVVYIGDGIPTWGETDAAALGALADAAAPAAIHAALVGKGASSALWADLSARAGGRAMVVRTPVDARRFALAAAHGGAARRIVAARIEVPAGAVLFPTAASTVYEGEPLTIVMRTPAGAPAPTSLQLSGRAGGRDVAQTLALPAPVAVRRVAQRWASQQIAAMDAAGAERDAIVTMSRDFGVLSRHTSLLVLESDEAYKQHQIERRQEKIAQAEEAVAPQVTGGDLDSLGARQASLSPDEIQPGDPEIKIPAPADARSVVLSFPSGETKIAAYDRELEAWMVRFLIDKDTPDGEYQVRATISHADGRVEVLMLSYTVDTHGPQLRLDAARVDGGYRLRARQVVGDGRKDADRVEVVLPDGAVLTLTQVANGRFEAVWPSAELAAPVTLRVVARDRALNQETSELVVGGIR